MNKRLNSLNIDPTQLVTIEQAHEKLGKGYSRSSILRRIKSGEWKEGIHWIDDRSP
ncbi:MAG: hypothetical protein HWQ35_04480 [Nostoc sp. NMS1]|uniref:hypothetical protein n=1 Tax=unclassified Nostoc TaxID=2593658 RepID=UPI0025E95A1D|nr:MULTISPECIES: hypothetical protein [unclassified Nostoc]MBN3905853.1 hypothetical protein [Nostoc sp. NMS1]MBN3991401.1 hypothetical protein [Nostoc sp. NMS2]